MSRRGNGDGSIRQCADGRWEATIRLAGRRYWFKGKTQADARAKLHDFQKRYHLGQVVEPRRLTLGQYLDQWLEAGTADWRPKTAHGYKSLIEMYWKPELGHVQLQRLTPAMLAASYAKWRPDRSGGTLLNVHRCLHRALVVAVRWGLVARNVADAVEAPKARRRRPLLWSVEQATQFLAATRGDRWHVLWALLLGTGCRLGEALALRWSDVDLATRTMVIQRSFVWAGNERVEGEPKTLSGVRTLVLPPFAVSALQSWHKAQVAERLAMGPAWPEGDLIVTLPTGGVPTQWQCRTAFHRACRGADLPPIRRHDLRHLTASVMLAQGLPLPAVARQLGHATPAITAAVYSHALMGADEQAAQALELTFQDRAICESPEDGVSQEGG
ncbi:MAG TPA: site-specific integrase [Chloroflexota bacterium]|nr:site-specific integrase [Chloroflexota bacterium]